MAVMDYIIRPKSHDLCRLQRWEGGKSSASQNYSITLVVSKSTFNGSTRTHSHSRRVGTLFLLNLVGFTTPVSAIMVLDEQSTSVHFEPDPPPSSSPDPYSSADLGIDFSQLPFGFFYSFPPYRNDRWKDRILPVLPQKAAHVRRPLTPDETQAIAYHYANGHAASTWNKPIGALIGAYRSYATRENYRVPFYGPLKREGGWFDGERIRIRGRELLRGERARTLVNAFRFSSYVFVASSFALVATTIYATVVFGVGLTTDPRLKDFNADLQALLQEKQPVRQVDQTGQGSRSTGEVSKEQRRKTSEAWKEAKEAKQHEKASGDEGSSLAGRDGREYAGNAGIAEAESDWSQEASEGGSAWERIRRGAGSSATAGSGTERRGRGAGGWQRQREQREGSGGFGGDDFTFSGTEAERSYAREEAQRDFDARVEKERQGGDFSEGSDGGRRWG